MTQSEHKAEIDNKKIYSQKEMDEEQNYNILLFDKHTNRSLFLEKYIGYTIYDINFNKLPNEENMDIFYRYFKKKYIHRVFFNEQIQIFSGYYIGATSISGAYCKKCGTFLFKKNKYSRRFNPNNTSHCNDCINETNIKRRIINTLLREGIKKANIDNDLVHAKYLLIKTNKIIKNHH